MYEFYLVFYICCHHQHGWVVFCVAAVHHHNLSIVHTRIHSQYFRINYIFLLFICLFILFFTNEKKNYLYHFALSPERFYAARTKRVNWFVSLGDFQQSVFERGRGFFSDVVTAHRPIQMYRQKKNLKLNESTKYIFEFMCKACSKPTK